jgi:hypothetical protein
MLYLLFNFHFCVLRTQTKNTKIENKSNGIMETYLRKRRLPNVQQKLNGDYEFSDKSKDFLTTHENDMRGHLEETETELDVDFTANPDTFSDTIQNAFYDEMRVTTLDLDSKLVHTLEEIVKLNGRSIKIADFNEQDWHTLKIWKGSWGFYSLESFKLRFDIATSGIFEGVNFQNLFVSGSIVAVCLFRNPLEKNYDISYEMDDDFLQGKITYEDLKVKWQESSANFIRYLDTHYPSKTTLQNQLSSKYEVYNAEQNLSDIDIIIDKNDNVDYDFIVKRLFANLKCKKKYLVKVDTAKSYKYIISSINLRYNIECFRVFSSTPMNTVTKYHFPIVRQLYNGQTVYMAPSCVILGLTGICHDYKWIACKTNAVDLILKYHSRGYNFNLNNSEHAFITKYLRQGASPPVLDRTPAS